MIPDTSGGGNSPHGPRVAARAGQTCWLCGYTITDPPEIIGHWHTTEARVAHRHCLRVLGELDLNLGGGT